MIQTFTWPVTTQVTGSGEFRTLKSQFGDGYSQEIGDGLNSDVQKYTVTLAGLESELTAPLAFIREHKGAKSFYWKPPLGVQGLYRCKTYTPVPQGAGVFTLTLEFQQVFAP